MSNKTIEFIRGKVYWPKILGEPVPNYNKDGREWTFEFEPDAEGVKILKKHKLSDRLKDKYEDQGRGDFLTLRKHEMDREGKPNKPIRVLDADGQTPWNNEVKLGNETIVDVKLDIRDYGPGKKKGMYPVAVRVVELVPYEGGKKDNGFEKIETANFLNKDEQVEKDFGVTESTATDNDDLDDDVPF